MTLLEEPKDKETLVFIILFLLKKHTWGDEGQNFLHLFFLYLLLTYGSYPTH